MTYLRNEGPIGIFDSGLGGLTVLSALQRCLPHEDFVYLGDTARSPYATRGKQTVLNYAHACARVLRDHRIKLLVSACSTTSALALPALGAELFIPAVGSIVPSLEAALGTGAQRIGVLASAYLAGSGDYAEALAALSAEASLSLRKCQLLCALLDDGFEDGALARLALREHLSPLLDAEVQAVVLGECGLSLWREPVRAELAAMSGKDLPIVDCVQPLVQATAQLLDARQLATARTEPGKLRVVLTDLPADLRVAQRYFGAPLSGVPVTSVDL